MNTIISRRRANTLHAIALCTPLATLTFGGALGAGADPASLDASARATATVEQMTKDEKTVLTYGIMPLPIGPHPKPPPADAVAGAGYISGIARLGIPALKETDASLGVAYIFGLRKDGATALPSGLAMASSWNPELIFEGGRMIGSEARAKGFNVMLAGGVNLARDPRNGRNFEYLGEDPLLAGTLVGASIRGIQSNHIIATIKHFAFNGQETGRKFVDVKIDEAAARESDLLAFQIGIETGRPGSVMCAYNRVRGQQACGSDWLLNKVLKKDWGYQGFVMSDWGAVTALRNALDGLDQQSGSELDAQVYFDKQLAEASHRDPTYAARLDDMNRRILTSVYANGLDAHPVAPGGSIDKQAHAAIAERVAQQGMVLLRNERNVLPLSKTARRIAVIGGFADVGVLSGAGSSQVQGEGGPAVVVPLGDHGPLSAFVNIAYHRSSPLAAIKAMAPQANVHFRDGRSVAEAVSQAKLADVAIVFATQWSSEGFDQADLRLPSGQDELIAAVAAANPNTVVVLQTGGPVLMPWLERSAAVVEAWYPGARGGEAIASLLFGDTNPSGRLPITFPAGENQLPRPKLDGFDEYEPDFGGNPPTPDASIPVDYDIEGSDVGYRWFGRQDAKPLFSFGFGLSYTRFNTDGLKLTAGKSTVSAQATARNVGDRAGSEVVQLYLTSTAGKRVLRLVGFQRIDLARGEAKSVSMTIDPRLLANWEDGGWHRTAGEYRFALGRSATELTAEVTLQLKEQKWRDAGTK